MDEPGRRAAVTAAAAAAAAADNNEGLRLLINHNTSKERPEAFFFAASCSACHAPIYSKLLFLESLLFNTPCDFRTESVEYKVSGTSLSHVSRAHALQLPPPPQRSLSQALVGLLQGKRLRESVGTEQED